MEALGVTQDYKLERLDRMSDRLGLCASGLRQVPGERGDIELEDRVRSSSAKGGPDPERPEGAGQAQDDPVGFHPDYFLPSRFFFTYAQIFFVISEGPIGLSPMTDSSVSVQPLKLSA
jgi:hypothetical protein